MCGAADGAATLDGQPCKANECDTVADFDTTGTVAGTAMRQASSGCVAVLALLRMWLPEKQVCCCQCTEDQVARRLRSTVSWWVWHECR